MDDTVLAILLSGLGGACEIGGVVIVALGIASDRRKATNLLDRPPLTPPDRTYPLPRPPGVSAPDYANRMYTESHRISGAIEAQQRFRIEVENTLVKLKQLTDAELDQAFQRLQLDAVERDRDLREGLRHVLTGGTRGRVLGVGLLFAGIVLAVAGSIVGTLA